MLRHPALRYTAALVLGYFLGSRMNHEPLVMDSEPLITVPVNDLLYRPSKDAPLPITSVEQGEGLISF